MKIRGKNLTMRTQATFLRECTKTTTHSYDVFTRQALRLPKQSILQREYSGRN